MNTCAHKITLTKLQQTLAFFEGNTNLSIKYWIEMLRHKVERESQPLSLKIKKICKRRLIDFVTEGIDCIFVVLSYLELDEICKLHEIYSQSKSKRQTENKIILYMTLAERKFSIREEKMFLKQIAKHSPNLALKNYSNENNTWKDPINLDIERTCVSSLGNTGFSDFNKQSHTISKQYLQIGVKDCKETQQQMQSLQPTRPMSMKFNFLIFSCDDAASKKQPERRRMQNISLKNYMRQVLNAISNRHPNLGYVQGLNCWIKHMYQTRLNQEEAFTYSCFLLQKMNAQELFKDSLLKARQLCYVFDIYLHNNLPKLSAFLKSCDVDSTVYSSNWWITLFSEQLSKKSINKLWHLFVLKGWKMLIKFGIAIMCVFEQEILQSQKDQIYLTLRNILLQINDEKEKNIWAIMNSIKVKNKLIEYLSKSMTLLSNDTEIQLWRLDHEKRHKEIRKIKKNFSSAVQLRKKEKRRPSLTTSSSLTSSKIHLTMSDKKLHAARILSEEPQWRCCGGMVCQQNTMKSDQVLLSPQEDYSFLSMCRSVRYQ